ncbi:MAG: PAS domain S-box protein [Candidatus Acidiferrales bacterium]
MSTNAWEGHREESDSAPESQDQVEKLTAAITRSQHNYRELIDNLDQALITISLQGEIRVANLRLSEILGVSFQELIGHSLAEFLESPTMADAEGALPAFLTAGFWAGTVAVRLKKDQELRHFSCWFQAIEENGKVASVTGWARDVTAAHESEIRFAELFESFSEGIVFVTPEGRLLDANPALVRMLGYESKEELQSRNFAENYADPKAREELIRELKEKGSVHDREIVLRRKDGKRIDCVTSGFAIRDASGRPVRLQGTIIDVTERREIERRLHQEQEFSRRLVASFPDLIAVLDREGRFTFISDQVQNMLGRTPEDFIGKQFGARAGTGDRKRLNEMHRRVLRGEESRAQFEFSAPHADGTWRVLLATAGPLFDEKGNITGMVTSARDVTDQRQIERQLHQEQEFVRRLIECFPDLIVVLDHEGKFKFVSDRVKDILGISPEDYIGKPVGQRVSAEDQSKLAEMFKNVVAGSRIQEQIEIRAQHVDGTWKVLRVSASPLFDETGKIMGMVSSGRDVTESKQLEQQLTQKEKLAAMGQMMTGVAHELNNPLTAILGVSDLLRERAADEATRRQVDLILKQARRAADIVQNLLAFGRPAMQGLTMLRIDDVVREAVLLEKSTLSAKNIEVKFESPGDLPAVAGDRKLLAQVFRNIIVNSEQAISAARDHGVISVSLSRAGQGVRVTITDDGIGIPPENLEKIFDPFFTTRRPGGGSGLGLAICLAVAKEHGGSIEVQSSPGSGATFRVLLPAAVASVPEAVPAAPVVQPVKPARAPAPAGSGALRGHTALIVDDEEGIREIVQAGLEGRGMKVHAADSSEAALAYLEKNTCEVVLCDFNLPGMNGEKLFERLRAQKRVSAPRFIFMTGELFDTATVERYREKGAFVLLKPFHISALATLLAEILEPQTVRAR